MNNHTPIQALFTSLNGSLPYEYDEKYVIGIGLKDTIVITKTDSERIIYITANTPDDDAIFDVNLYNDIYDDDPTETTQWDTDDPNLTLIDLIDYIKKSL